MMLATYGSAARRRAIPLRRGWRHMRLSTAVEQFLADCRVRGLSAATLTQYGSDLKILVAHATVDAQDTVLAFTPELVSGYFRRLSAKGLSMATLHRRRAAVAEFGKWGVRHRLWAEDPTVVLPTIRRPAYLPRPFTADERERLVALPLLGEERLLRALLFYTALRVSPVCGIRLADISTRAVEMDGVTWPGSIRTVGKGSKPHVVPMHPELRDLVFDYVTTATDLKPTTFLLRQRNGRPWSRKMIERRTRAWGVAANVLDCEPHRFRHTTATLLLEAGVDVRVIQRFLAHEDISTTMLYTKVADRQVADAVLRLPSFLGPTPAPPGATTPPAEEPEPDRVLGSGSVPYPHDPPEVPGNSAE